MLIPLMQQMPLGVPAGTPQPQGLLEQLRDLALPKVPSWWPPAPGWWFLLFFVLLAVGIIWYLRKHYPDQTPPTFVSEIHRVARMELRQLRENFSENNDHARLIAGLSTLLRRVSMTLNDRDHVAALTGRAWLNWLAESAGEDIFADEAGQLFISAQYQSNPQFDAEQVIQQCERWIECVFVQITVQDD